ncbi:MAG: hypothetical protein F6K23_07650 [Okeania sp. SIO2C9]|uniref:hypothetical protein n=1 Tax=Okeania sp. SIO2C9 TaxID=2607791 RepID=UPI0013C25EB6|nr:hypothetical protein [Okeania sp. SIO2C9]NEQ72955.1 hypothetical protein [Okeania sp. SIO2C9]
MFFNKKKRLKKQKEEELKEVIKLLSQVNNEASKVRKNRHNPSFKIAKNFLKGVQLALIFLPIIGGAEPAIAGDFEDLDFDGDEIDIGEIGETILDNFIDLVEGLNDIDFDELYLNVEYIDMSDLTLDELQSARFNLELILKK